MLLLAISEDSLLFVLISKILPSLVTVLAGGYVASILFPRMQRKYQRTLQVEEKKVEIAEALLTTFGRYVVAWGRLIAISKHEVGCGLSPEEMKRKEDFLKDRKTYRDELADNIRLAQLYFSANVCDGLNEFAQWDAQQSVKLLDDLPPISEWLEKEKELLGLVKDEIT